MTLLKTMLEDAAVAPVDGGSAEGGDASTTTAHSVAGVRDRLGKKKKKKKKKKDSLLKRMIESDSSLISKMSYLNYQRRSNITKKLKTHKDSLLKMKMDK